MKTGFGAVQAAIEKSKSRGQGGSFLPYFVWKDDRNGEGKRYEKTLRFLTDDVVPCRIYEYIPCKDGKMRDFIVPESVGLEGPDIVQESGVRIPQFNNKSNLIAPKARDIALGLAVLREEKAEMIEGRRVLTYKDVFEEVTYEKDGKQVTETRPVFGIVKQSNTNFWGPMAGYWSRYGTIMDRDYNITRNGNGVDTNYTIIPCDPIEELRDEENLKKAYNPPTTLEKLVENLASPERARKLLMGEGAPEKKTSEEPKGDVEASSNSQFSSLRDELMSQD